MKRHRDFVRKPSARHPNPADFVSSLQRGPCPARVLCRACHRDHGHPYGPRPSRTSKRVNAPTSPILSIETARALGLAQLTAEQIGPASDPLKKKRAPAGAHLSSPVTGQSFLVQQPRPQTAGHLPGPDQQQKRRPAGIPRFLDPRGKVL